MTHHLTGKKVAFLVADRGTDYRELVEPLRAVQEAGAEGVILSTKAGTVETKRKDSLESGDIQVQHTFAEASSADYDAVVIPGGTVGADRLRTDADAVALVRRFVEEGKPVASICHGPWLLVEAGVLDGRRLTSYKSLKTDIINAGGEWIDEEVVVDRGLVTSRGPDDLPAFNRKLVEEIAEGVHAREAVSATG
ncbi:MAG TPA: type 1 glutamine amidotransferase domain-containing protein [Trueperaceae bacterium]|nr:type 1 glutamine amidotransferase domain-containing protein [Trueperaceae bacterium]